MAACGSAFIAAQQQTGVAAAAKHFPGLGAATATQDTDARTGDPPVPLATSRHGRGTLPAAIAAGLELVMLSWAMYPALDAHAPAGLSAAVVRVRCAGGCGFRGSRSPMRSRRARWGLRRCRRGRCWPRRPGWT